VARDVAWVAGDNLHLTLKFLGGVETERLEALAGAVRAAAASCDPFELNVEGLGAFPSPSRPRVLWAGVHEGAGPAAELARRIDDALAPLGCAREARTFAAHVTLGRVREPRANLALAAALARDESFGRQRVERVTLMRSELSPRGARHSELAAAPLGPGSPG
jgi:2'-5' RNA ligase